MRSFLIMIVLGALALLARTSEAAKKHIEAVKEGNLAYQQGDFKKALEEYHIAEADRPESPGIDYNIGNTLYEEGDFAQAADRLTKALNTDEVGLAARAQYNLGNAQYRAGDYQKAIEAYKASLDLNPDDMEAKYNLELARRMLKEQTQPEQSQDQEQQQQEQQEKEQQEQEQDQQQQDQQQEQQQQNQQEDEDQKRDEQQRQQPQDQKEMSKEDAERILNALQDDEQDIQKRIRRNKAGTGYVGKDW